MSAYFRFAFATLAMAFLVAYVSIYGFSSISDLLTPGLTPWKSVGGCCCSNRPKYFGSTKIKWIGKGVTGGLIDVQGLLVRESTPNSIETDAILDISTHPTWESTLDISVPLKSRVDQIPSMYQSKLQSGLGDITIEFAKLFGMNGDYSSGLGLRIPTGDYYAQSASGRLLPPEMQLGEGIYSLTFDLATMRYLPQSSFFIAIFGYKQPLLSAFNSYTKSPAFSAGTLSLEGKNQTGISIPSSIDFSLYYSQDNRVNQIRFPMTSNTFGINFMFPLRPSTAFNPLDSASIILNPNHRCWNATLNYSIELNSSTCPLFFAFYLPFFDSRTHHSPQDSKYAAEVNAWGLPDRSEIFRSWILVCGFQFTTM